MRDYLQAKGTPAIRHIPGESFEHRHKRRLQFNLEAIPLVRAWCERYGIAFETNDDFKHWEFLSKQAGGTLHAEWWPETAKLVINGRWNKSFHCHDFFQLTTELVRPDGTRRRGMPLDCEPIKRREYREWKKTHLGVREIF